MLPLLMGLFMSVVRWLVTHVALGLHLRTTSPALLAAALPRRAAAATAAATGGLFSLACPSTAVRGG